MVKKFMSVIVPLVLSGITGRGARADGIPQQQQQIIPRILLTNFEPFGGRSENSSQVIVEALLKNWATLPSDQKFAELDSVTLPVSYDDAPTELARKMDSFHPDYVISIGEAGDPTLRLETIAHNLDGSPLADNRGVSRMDEKIVRDGPENIATRLPIDAIATQLRGAHVPFIKSKSAGGYVCNHIFYHLMYLVTTEAQFKHTVAGFIHVPALSLASHPDYGDKGAAALRLILQTIVSPQK